MVYSGAILGETQVLEVKIGGMGKGGRLNRKRREWKGESGEWREWGVGEARRYIQFLFCFFISILILISF